MPRKKTKEVGGNHKEKLIKKQVGVNLNITSIPKDILESVKNGDKEKVEKECTVLVENKDDVFQAEAIIKVRLRKGQIEYLVKWAGVIDCTWEPKKNILDSRLLDNFKEQNLKSKKKRGRPAVPKKIRVIEKNRKSTKMKERDMQKATLGIKRKKTDTRPEKNNVEKKKRGRPPVVKEFSEPIGNSKRKAGIKSNKLQDCPKPDQQVQSSHLDNKMDTPELDEVNAFELNEVDSSELDNEVGSSEVGEMADSPKHAIGMNSSENDNAMDLSESCVAVYESMIPELAPYFPASSPATSNSKPGINSQLLANSSSVSGEAAPCPQKSPSSSMAGISRQIQLVAAETAVAGTSRHTGLINQPIFSVAGGVACTPQHTQLNNQPIFSVNGGVAGTPFHTQLNNRPILNEAARPTTSNALLPQRDSTHEFHSLPSHWRQM